ncbi:MAG: hypothetical protein CMM03_10555 [Rhodopirellula sp.]|nr:hypothetical protein [Rhodopirellula sp.]
MFRAVGYRRPLKAWIESNPSLLTALEVTAEHFFDNQDTLYELREGYPISVHGLGLSLGSEVAIAQDVLENFRKVADAANAEWISEHLAFTRTKEADLGHLNPVISNRRNLEKIRDRCRHVMDFCQRPLLLENITTHINLPGELGEAEFLNELCEQAQISTLLDITNLFINSRNHRFDPFDWIRQLNPKHIKQVHLVGYSKQGNKFFDNHGSAIQSELWDIFEFVINYATIDCAIIERDLNLPAIEELETDLKKMKTLSANL